MELISLTAKGDMIEALTSEAAARGITDAAVVSVVGAVRSFTLTNMKVETPRETVDTSGKYAELSGNGEILGGVPNIHVTCGLDGGGRAVLRERLRGAPDELKRSLPPRVSR
jgi:predicted DNA-binding protein with PD1-like motif